MAMFSKLSILLLIPLMVSCGNDKGNAPSLQCSNCRMFLSASTSTGNFQGVDGADALCEADANNPGDGVFKAYLTDFIDRGFDVPDWVMRADTNYYRLDGVLIKKTNALAQMTQPLDNAISTSNVRVWTGGTPHCNSWGDGTSGASSMYGNANSTTTYSGAGSQTCDTVSHVYCVEQ